MTVEEEIARQALQYVENFFGGFTGEEKAVLPKILKSHDVRWMVTYEGSTLGIYPQTRADLERSVEYNNMGLPSFPGFTISEDEIPDGAPVAITASGSCLFYSSNYTANMFAFSVLPGCSLAVVDHFHEVIVSSSGDKLEYHVDLAFILGIDQGEQWDHVKLRLHELLNHTMGVWKILHES